MARFLISRDRVPALDRVLRALGVRPAVRHPPARARTSCPAAMSLERLRVLDAWVAARSKEPLAGSGVHELLTHVVDEVHAICGTLGTRAARSRLRRYRVQSRDMPNLLAMSFEGELAPSFTLHCLERGRTLPDGWGLGYYPAGEPSAAILKEPAPPQGSMRSQLALAWEQVASSLFVLHIRHATWGALSDANTQPFSRTWGRRDWLFAHAGSLDRSACRDRRARSSRSARPTPSSSSASCSTSSSSATGGASPRSISTSLRRLARRAQRDRRHDAVPHRRARPARPRRSPRRAAVDRRARAAVRADRVRRRRPRRRSHAARREEPQGRRSSAPSRCGRAKAMPSTAIDVAPARAGPAPRDPRGRGRSRERSTGGRGRDAARRRRVPRAGRAAHATTSCTARSIATRKPSSARTHLLRLTPVHDRLQTRALARRSTSRSPGQSRDYEDVFGNRVRRLAVESPFTELVIEAQSTVEVLDIDPLGFGPLQRAARRSRSCGCRGSARCSIRSCCRPSCRRPSSPSSPSTR